MDRKTYMREYMRRRRSDPEKKRAEDEQRAGRIHEVRASARRASVKYRAANTASTRAAVKKWHAAHPLMNALYLHRRKARKLGAPGTCSPAQLQARIDLYGGLCWVPGCGKAYEAIDHVIPLAKGGSNWPSNLRPICTHHNSVKGARKLGVVA